jgi:hypothetical protein
MVNPESVAFRFSEKVGFIIGKGIRYIIMGSVVFFLKGKFIGPTNTPPYQAPPKAP